jgi:hypothetical protein
VGVGGCSAVHRMAPSWLPVSEAGGRRPTGVVCGSKAAGCVKAMLRRFFDALFAVAYCFYVYTPLGAWLHTRVRCCGPPVVFHRWRFRYVLRSHRLALTAPPDR